MKKRILVTGGTGYIGAHTTVELFNAGYEPIIIDNLSNSNREVLKGIEKIVNQAVMFEEIDCQDVVSLRGVFEKYAPISGVIHFAAKKAVGESVEKPLEYYRNNLVSLLNLLEAMETCAIRHLVFSSSCTVYGQPSTLPVNEEAPIKPATSPYGNTKQICEEIITDYAAVHPHFSAMLLRYFNPIGAHPSALIGELPIGKPANLVPFITQTACGIQKELQIFGNDYNTPDGSCIRDYIYVLDLARAHIVAMEKMFNDGTTQNVHRYNLGTGKGVSVLQLVHTFEEATGIKIPYKVVERRAGDIEQIWADPSKANNELHWHAETPLAESLRTAWNWEKYIRNKNK